MTDHHFQALKSMFLKHIPYFITLIQLIVGLTINFCSSEEEKHVVINYDMLSIENISQFQISQNVQYYNQ